MRAATVTLSWNHSHENPIPDVFGVDDAVSLESIRYVNPIGDGRYVELLDLRGDLERARTLLEDAPEAIEYDLVGDDDRGVAYVQWHTAGFVGDLLSILDQREIVIDWPITAVETETDRGLELTVVGTDWAIEQAATDLPDGVSLELHRLGSYRPQTARQSATLTERQRAVFELALAEGYYEVPRETTQRDLADKLDCATGTVAEHLQRIESAFASAYAASIHSQNR